MSTFKAFEVGGYGLIGMTLAGAACYVTGNSCNAFDANM